MQGSDTLILTKLRPPFIRPDLVPRPHLSRRIAEGLRGPLVLIAAPAGFGKTTLAASAVTESNRAMAWLSLDKDDNRTDRFLGYLLAALRQADGTIGDEASQLLAGGQAPPSTILASLINDLDHTTTEIALVLDDYQFISDKGVHRQLTFLLEHCPRPLHLVIATRSDPPLPLSRLRVRGQLVEIRATDLRFAGAETARFLNDVMGLHLDDASVAVLEKRTEGWIAGLQMAALSMRNQKDVSGFIEGFSGTNRYILDYLLEEVLANQRPAVQDFLLRTSVLDRLTAPLCDALLEADGDAPATVNSPSADILAYLARADLFLVPLDDAQLWYRYHHLFADLLRARLQQTLSDQDIATLHARAGRWYEGNGLAHEAVHHASLISDHAWVERLIEQNYMEMFQRRDSSSIRLWTADIDQEEIFARPRLSLHEAMWRSWTGQLDAADRYLDAAERRIPQAPADADGRAMLGHLAYVRSRVTAMRGDVPRAIELCLAARAYTPAGNKALQGGIGVMLGYGYFLAGDFANAIPVLEQTIEEGVAAGAINSTMGAYCVLARLLAIQGRLHRSWELYQEADRYAAGAGDQDLGIKGLAGVGAAELRYEWDDLEGALTQVEQGMTYIPYWSKADDMVMAYTTLARVQHAQGRTAQALETIEKGTHLIRVRGVFSEARELAVTTEMRLRLAAGEPDAVYHWAKSVASRLNSRESAGVETEPARMMLARTHIAARRPTRAMVLLVPLEVAAEAGVRQARLIEILNLKALAHQMLGDRAAARTALTRSLALAEPEGYARIFVDEGTLMQAQLTAWLADADPGPLQAYVDRLLSKFGSQSSSRTTTQPTAGAPAALIDPLSPRELEVLDLIALGLTNKEIAERLFVAPGTVKAHTSSIYRKLDVANRTEAVARARDLGVLV